MRFILSTNFGPDDARSSRNGTFDVQNGFSLIELLVVISVLALMIGILLPVLGSARGVARAAKCGSNLRQLGIAQHAYAADHEQWFVPMSLGSGHSDPDWTEVLAGYFQRALADRDDPNYTQAESNFNVARGGGAILRCPEDGFAFPTRYGVALGIDHVGSSEGWLSYGLNSGLVSTVQGVQRFCGVGGNSSESLRDPSATAHHLDATYIRYVSDVAHLIQTPFLDGVFVLGTPDARSHFFTPAPIIQAAHRREHAAVMGDAERVYRHGGSMNVLYADGHVSRRAAVPTAAEDPVFWGPVYEAVTTTATAP
ncbi:MAG: DUF1559 domain-containing protein [Planctomycetota bacterium]